MRMRKGLWAAIAALVLTGGALAQDSVSDGEAVKLFSLPPPPPLSPSDTPAAPGLREAPAKMTALMAPPPPRACITAEQYNKAAGGSGCSCTCQEYARKPVSDTCDIACGGHPQCWMPKPTDAEVNAEFDKVMQNQPAAIARASSSLSAEERDNLRAGIGMLRAFEWSEARKCPSGN